MAINLNHQDNALSTSNDTLNFQSTMVQNLNVERVSTDPSLTVSGRVWYNTTDRHIKMSALNDSGQLVVKQIPIKDDLDSAIAQVNSYVANLKLQQLSNVQDPTPGDGLRSGDVLIYAADIDKWLVSNYLYQQVMDAGEF
jgi:DNA gyrase/topoisomerase IV subunit A